MTTNIDCEWIPQYCWVQSVWRIFALNYSFRFTLVALINLSDDDFNRDAAASVLLLIFVLGCHPICQFPPPPKKSPHHHSLCFITTPTVTLGANLQSISIQKRIDLFPEQFVRLHRVPGPSQSCRSTLLTLQQHTSLRVVEQHHCNQWSYQTVSMHTFTSTATTTSMPHTHNTHWHNTHVERALAQHTHGERWL